MEHSITGIHHITVIGGDPQHNADFYGQVLGLKLIKKTINFDAPNVYHLYYGDNVGHPGTILTFFPYGKDIPRSKRGFGEVAAIAFSVPKDSLAYWAKRLEDFRVKYEGPTRRSDEHVIAFEDFDGTSLELVANSHDERNGRKRGPVPSEYAIKGFFGVTLSLPGSEQTVDLMTRFLDYRFHSHFEGRARYETGESGPGTYVDILGEVTNQRALQGNGSVHHIAFRASDEEIQQKVREKLVKMGYFVTEVKDRQYFKSVYFREPGGVLFEVATDGPGFLIDENEELLGRELKLPPWEEANRSAILEHLPPIHVG